MKIKVKKTQTLTFAAVAFMMMVPALAGASTSRELIDNPAKNMVAPTPEAKSGYTKMDFLMDLQNILRSNDLEGALNLFENIPENLAEDFELRFIKASILLSANRLDDAQSICSELQKIDPKNNDVIFLAAEIAKRKGNKAEKKKQLDALLAQDKLNPEANIELGEDSFNSKKYKQALQYYKRALSRDPKNVDALWGAGQTDYYLERDEESKKYFNKILEIEPSNARAWWYLGKIAYANNEYFIASKNVKKALEIEPGNYDFNIDYGMYERYMGHTDNAIAAWTKAISIDPKYFLAYAYRAGLYDENNKFKEAIKDYDMVIKLNPKYYYAFESIGILALHEKQWAKARKYFEKCYEYNKDNISYPLMVTYCFYMENNPMAAKNFSDNVLRKMTDRNSIEYKMLRVFHDQAGDKNLAQQIANVSIKTIRGKMYYYLGLYCDMVSKDSAAYALDYYTKVTEMENPMFFEYRLAEWRVKEDKSDAKGTAK